MSEPALLDPSMWVTYPEIEAAMGICAPELKTLVRLSHSNPRLKYATIESRRNATKYWNRKLFVEWVSIRFRHSPVLVEDVKARLLSPKPPSPAKNKRGLK